ncbi:hypothetical protein GCM10009678_15110 [Actinomadura kijaniata]|uniref:Uncharacterized protein n=1 Tax=Actinomadura namibiensis TaxID=182080 RepID=A0A7W3QMK8_ACTNM|nr:hypothetical protein [Actinomadura namibiensis]MBA8952677.1 hypothetical protein [Actinomadura namibiensis]
MILVPLAVVAMAVLYAPPGFQAWRGHGTWGVFTAEERRCTGGKFGTSCRWHGRFVSDDGTVRLTGVIARGDAIEVPGGKARVLMNDGDLVRAGSREWMFWAIWGLCGVAGEFFVLRALARRLRTSRSR